MPVAVRRQFGGEFFVYFVNIVCYQGMKEGWKVGRNTSNHVRSLDSLCAMIRLEIELSWVTLHHCIRVI